MKSLEEEMCQLMPLNATSKDKDIIFNQLKQAICQTNDRGDVIGGILFQFTTENYTQSKAQCEECLREVMHESGIEQKYRDAFINSTPIDITGIMGEMETDYFKKSCGPSSNKSITEWL